MPNRILRDGILSSEAVATLGWPAEVFYRRLMSVVDDHGRFHGLPKLIRSACYPLQIDKVTDADIGKWLTECVTAALVSVYPASDGKRYLQVEKFGQQVRSKSKFPEPIAAEGQQPQSSDIGCEQLLADAHLDGGVFVDVVEGVIPAAPRRTPPADLLEGVDPQVAKDFLALRKTKRAPLTQTALDGIVRELPAAGLTLTEALRFCCEKGWQSFKAVWYFNAQGDGSSVPREAPRRRKELK